MHLTEATYSALLAGTLPPKEARELAAHLEGDCDACERFLAERGGADGLDGSADAAIAAALPPRGSRGDDLEFARIRQALRLSPGIAGRGRLLALGAVAASLLVVGVAGLLATRLRAPPAERAAWDGLKGTEARAIPVRLRFLLLDAGGRVEKGLPGEPADRGASLLFEVEAGRPSDVVLARVAPDGGVELFWRGRVQAGRTQVTAEGRPAAYPLAALAGTQRFVLLAAEAGLDDARANRAAGALAPPARIRPEAPALDGLSFDVLEVPVR